MAHSYKTLLVEKKSWWKCKAQNEYSAVTRVICMDVWIRNTMLVSLSSDTRLQNISHTEAWFVVRGMVKTYSHSNKTSHLVYTRFLTDFSWSPRESIQVFTWLHCNSLVINTWFWGDFHIISLPLPSDKCFQNTSHKHLFSIFWHRVISSRQ